MLFKGSRWQKKFKSCRIVKFPITIIYGTKMKKKGKHFFQFTDTQNSLLIKSVFLRTYLTKKIQKNMPHQLALRSFAEGWFLSNMFL